MSERITETPREPDEFEQTLGRLQPQTSGISRERLMFLAGQQAARRQLPSHRQRVWPLATAASWLITATIAGLWLQSQQGEPDVQIAKQEPAPAVVPEVIEPPPAATIAESHVTPTDDTPATPQREFDSHWRDAFSLGDDDLLSGRFSRVTAIGVRRLRLPLRPIASENDSPIATATVPDSPATYRHLMQLYLNDQPGFETEGDLL